MSSKDYNKPMSLVKFVALSVGLSLVVIILFIPGILMPPEKLLPPTSTQVVQTEVSVQDPMQIAKKTGKSCGTVEITVNGEKFTGELKTVNYPADKDIAASRIVKIFFPENVYREYPWLAPGKTSLNSDPLWQAVNDACLK